MIDLPQIAVDFCRECLGWERPVDRKFAEMNQNAAGDGGSRAWSPYIFDFYGRHDQFHYTDLNVVLKAAWKWSDKAGCPFELRYSPYLHGVGVLCEGLEVWDEDACHALLAACVEVNRKLGVRS